MSERKSMDKFEFHNACPGCDGKHGPPCVECTLWKALPDCKCEELQAKVERLTEVIRKVQPVIDDVLGDTDPDFPDDFEETDILDDEPLVWVHMQLVSALKESGNE